MIVKPTLPFSQWAPPFFLFENLYEETNVYPLTFDKNQRIGFVQ